MRRPDREQARLDRRRQEIGRLSCYNFIALESRSVQEKSVKKSVKKWVKKSIRSAVYNVHCVGYRGGKRTAPLAHWRSSLSRISKISNENDFIRIEIQSFTLPLIKALYLTLSWRLSPVLVWMVAEANCLIKILKRSRTTTKLSWRKIPFKEPAH